MKASDFFIVSRQFFGFLIPGVLWITAWMLFHGTNPFIYLTGNAWLPRLLLFLGLGFVIGFSIQTALFLLIMEYREYKHHRRTSETLPAKIEHSIGGSNDYEPGIPEHGNSRAKPQSYRADLLSAINKDLKGQPVDCLTDDQLPRFCKHFVLENSTHLREHIIELEGEINFMVGIALPLLVLPISWIRYENPDPSSWEYYVVAATSMLIGSCLLLRRVPRLREGEELMWCEMYLLLRSGRQ